MAIRRISELDLFTSADLSQFLSTENITDTSEATFENVPDMGVYDNSKISTGLWLEVSTPREGLSCIEGEPKNIWIVKPVNEANSYYLSKKINMLDLSKLFGWKYDIFMNKVQYGPMYYTGSQNFGEPNTQLDDGVDTVYFDKNPGDPDNPNRLCVMISTDFTNQVTFHNNVDFHGTGGHIQIHRTNTTNHSWPGGTISVLSGPWMEFDRDIVVDGTAYINNLVVNNPIHGVALCACWADLAENYASDFCYSPGTLVKFGGEEEITLATDEANAVISKNPGVLLDSGKFFKRNLPIALSGKIPVRVVGKVKKFDKIGLSKTPGVGKAIRRGKHVGIALESSDEEGEKLVNCVVQLTL